MLRCVAKYAATCVVGAILLTSSGFEASADKAKSWTGFYVGLVGTYDWTKIEYPDAPPYVAPPAPCNGCGPPRPHLEGTLLGGTIGFNFQSSQFVFGVEGDYSFGDIDVVAHDGNYLTETFNIDQTATLRGRLGFVVGDFMPYFTAGVAFERLEFGAQCPPNAAFGLCSVTGAFDLRDTEWNVGYVVGGGVEWAATQQVSIKLEGLYTDFGRETYDVGSGPFDIDHHEGLLRLGANYGF